MSSIIRAHRVAVAGLAALALVGLSGCGSSGPGTASAQGGDGAELQLWTLQNEGINGVQQEAVDRYNEGSDDKMVLSTYVNDPYKAKLQTAIGSPNAPSVFYNWGGGNLKGYVDAGQVTDLTAAFEASDVKERFISSVVDVATIDGKVYGIPMQGVQPVSFYTNKDVLKAAGITEFPVTWTEFLAMIEQLKGAGVQPIALAGSQGWTELMYVEYFLDRIGGPEKFQAIAAGEDGAWTDPAVVRSMEMVQELVDAGAFGSNYAAVSYDNNGSQALLTSGKAAMELMGSWEVTSLNDAFPAFLEAGSLGWADFPAIEDGAGDPANIVGNPSNFYSVSARAADPKAATDFLLSQMASDEYVDGMIGVGQVPAIMGLEEKVNVGKFAEFNAFAYDRVLTAPVFTQSWDQALPAALSQTMLTNIQQVFNKQMSPQEFADAMDAAA
ncbi:extracellular solute-binding protein [Pengzhenrongella phosphoraccumulans]|jgi:xylobiose transport system substrate-binding protein|uniref:extracellular solute-binding protein n=1 Tax=Pengzhenrongella phosphoraccumulans TaxID=3114394 RepID=UPI003890807B